MQPHEMSDYILLVDDNPSNLDVLSLVLERAGYPIERSMYGVHALEQVNQKVPALILLDINMPDMNGIEVCKKLKTNVLYQEIPIIFLTSYDDIETKEAAFKAGGVDYVTKPFQASEVLARVRSQLQIRASFLQLEEMRQKERRYFEELIKIKDDFFRTASHDLKNPLTSLRLTIDMLQSLNERGQVTNERLGELVDRMSNRVDDILNLIHNLLDLARLETGKAVDPQRIEITPIVKAAWDTIQDMAQKKQIRVLLEMPVNHWCIMGDSLQLRRVLENLLSNAVKYSPPETVVRLRAEQQGKELLISVEDHGYGIPQEDLENIFQRFFRVDRPEHQNEEGTGLGLSIVKSIVEQHQGQISVKSVLSQGTCFTISLPALPV